MKQAMGHGHQGALPEVQVVAEGEGWGILKGALLEDVIEDEESGVGELYKIHEIALLLEWPDSQLQLRFHTSSHLDPPSKKDFEMIHIPASEDHPEGVEISLYANAGDSHTRWKIYADGLIEILTCIDNVSMSNLTTTQTANIPPQMANAIVHNLDI